MLTLFTETWGSAAVHSVHYLFTFQRLESHWRPCVHCEAYHQRDNTISYSTIWFAQSISKDKCPWCVCSVTQPSCIMYTIPWCKSESIRAPSNLYINYGGIWRIARFCTWILFSFVLSRSGRSPIIHFPGTHIHTSIHMREWASERSHSLNAWETISLAAILL